MLIGEINMELIVHNRVESENEIDKKVERELYRFLAREAIRLDVSVPFLQDNCKAQIEAKKQKIRAEIEKKCINKPKEPKKKPTVQPIHEYKKHLCRESIFILDRYLEGYGYRSIARMVNRDEKM